MASIQKNAKGYRAQVAVKGARDSATFRTKREAEAWAADRERELRGQAVPATTMTLGDVLRYYRDEVSIHNGGARTEIIRINAMMNAGVLPLALKLGEVTTLHLVEWRRSRSAQVRDGTVLREIGQLGAIFRYAIEERHWIKESPLKDVPRPAEPDHREVVIRWREIRALLRALDYSSRRPVREVRHALGACFMLALYTGMRSGEMTNLTWARVKENYIVLDRTKTKPRDVPLSGRAKRVIAQMRGWDYVSVFNIAAQTRDALFRKYRYRAGLSGFTFHDTRHTAATILAQHLHVLDLCKMFGWTNPKRAMIYYNPKASDIAKRLR